MGIVPPLPATSGLQLPGQDCLDGAGCSLSSTESPYPVTSCYDMPVGEGVYYPRTQQTGLVYETFSFVDGPQARPGVSVLLHDGSDLGGLSAEEADQHLVPLGPTGLDYQFTNLDQLHHDYAAGLFEEALHHARQQYVAPASPGRGSRVVVLPQLPDDRCASCRKVA